MFDFVVMASTKFRTTGFILGEYELGQRIGSGGSATVHLGRHITTGNLVAMKEFVNDAGHKKNLRREIVALKDLRHPNIIGVTDIIALKEEKIYLVLEYASGGNLTEVVNNGGAMEEAVAMKYFVQLISAVHYMHSKGVFHRDIKPDNILIDAEGNLKITDFGLSACTANMKDGRLFDRFGTYSYMAPEKFTDGGHNGMTPDLWACGIVLYFMLVAGLPFESHIGVYAAEYRKIKQGEKTPTMSHRATYLISRLLDRNPSTRLSCEALLHFGWFKSAYVPIKPCSEHHSQRLANFRMDMEEVLESNFLCIRRRHLQVVNPFKGLGEAARAVICSLPTDGASSKVLFIERRQVMATLEELEKYAEFFSLDVVRKRQILVIEEHGGLCPRMGFNRLTIIAEVHELSPLVSALILRKTRGSSLQSRRMWEDLCRDIHLKIQ